MVKNHTQNGAQEWLMKKRTYKELETSRLWHEIDLDLLQTTSEDNSLILRHIRMKLHKPYVSLV